MRPSQWPISWRRAHPQFFIRTKLPVLTCISLLNSVCNRIGDPVPGPRPAQLFKSIDFPWQTVVDEVEEVDSSQSYRVSMLLSREGLICGPSSGMALQALLNALQKAKDEGRLAEFAAADGRVRAVFTCCDLPYQYMDNYAKKLGPSAFKPIDNIVSGSQFLDQAMLDYFQHELLFCIDSEPSRIYWASTPPRMMRRGSWKQSLPLTGCTKQLSLHWVRKWWQSQV